MNTFVNAVANQKARTTNGMKARKSTSNANVDLFFKIGASRGKNIVPDFTAAFVEDKDLALRIAQWSRDIRGGVGEREVFRQILKNLEVNSPEDLISLLPKVPEIGRWDDLLVLLDGPVGSYVVMMIRDALANGNGLAAKWMPRKGEVAVKLRTAFGWTPKFYRKRLVELTKVVESQMCAKQWDAINFSHVPSLAASRYKKAFYKNAGEVYKAYVDALVKGDPSVKVNAGAVYPYDVIKGFCDYRNKTQINFITKQWEALPNFVGDASVLPIVDVSGSMSCPVGRNSSVTCMDVSVSLGLYLADKNRGPFKDTFMTFSGSPELLRLKGNIAEKLNQIRCSQWDMNTDLNKAIKKILDVAIEGNASTKDMPKILLILSDMQFDGCVKYDDSAIQMIGRKYEAAGYEMPKVVFWNLNAHDNSPVKFDKNGVALVSGFSPAIMKSVLAADLEQFTPESIMRKAVMIDRYNLG